MVKKVLGWFAVMQAQRRYRRWGRAVLKAEGVEASGHYEALVSRMLVREVIGKQELEELGALGALRAMTTPKERR